VKGYIMGIFCFVLVSVLSCTSSQPSLSRNVSVSNATQITNRYLELNLGDTIDASLFTPKNFAGSVGYQLRHPNSVFIFEKHPSEVRVFLNDNDRIKQVTYIYGNNGQIINSDDVNKLLNFFDIKSKENRLYCISGLNFSGNSRIYIDDTNTKQMWFIVNPSPNNQNYEVMILVTVNSITFNLQTADEFYEQALYFGSQSDYDRAIIYLTQAIMLNPDFTLAYFYRGLAYLDSGDNNSAISDYTQAIRLDPNFADAYADRGLAYFYKDEFDLAISDWETTLRINPNHPKAQGNIELAKQRRE